MAPSNDIPSYANNSGNMKPGGGSGSSHNHRIYHEKQIRELCALHTLNNLFQGEKRLRFNQLLFFFNNNSLCISLIHGIGRTWFIHKTSTRHNLSIAGPKRLDQSTSICVGTWKLRYQCNNHGSPVKGLRGQVVWQTKVKSKTFSTFIHLS